MSHFWVQFPGDVAVFGRHCQFEILTVPESFQKDWHFVNQGTDSPIIIKGAYLMRFFWMFLYGRGSGPCFITLAMMLLKFKPTDNHAWYYLPPR